MNFGQKMKSGITRISEVIFGGVGQLVSGFKISHLPPMMVYFAFGASALTSIVGVFWVKEYLNLTPAFLAGVMFWASLPWILKVPMGHIVDLYWRWKALFVYAGAALLAGSFTILYGLMSKAEWMTNYGSIQTWYALSAIMVSTGYVIQDVVADAMTVEAVDQFDEKGAHRDEQVVRKEHVTMQTLGRVAGILGSVAVALLNLFAFADVGTMSEAERMSSYLLVMRLAYLIPAVSIVGVLIAWVLTKRRKRAWRKHGFSSEDIARKLRPSDVDHRPNWNIVISALVYVVFVLVVGGAERILNAASTDTAGSALLRGLVQYNEEIVFLGSLLIVVYIMIRLGKLLSREQRYTFAGTALVIFLTGLAPQPGEGVNWWQIDVLGFDQHFQSILLLTANIVALLLMARYLRSWSNHSVLSVSIIVAVIGTIFMLPMIAMYWGAHVWITSVTGGLITARTIAVVNIAVQSPLQQVAMIPAMAWAANSAPRHLKATFFAVIATYANVASSGSRLLTKYLNEVLPIQRGDYHNVGNMLIVTTCVTLALPFVALLIIKLRRSKSW